MITVYTKHPCRLCERVMKLLRDADVPFKIVDVGESPSAYDYVTNVLGARSVPVVTSGVGDTIKGYQPEAIKDLIAAYRYAHGLTPNEEREPVSSPEDPRWGDLIDIDTSKIHDYVWEGDE